MGWSNCGKDSKGRPIGYAFEATCDHPGCNKIIHRGLAYACGYMHGENEYSCEGYFCDEHLYYTKYQGKTVCVCEGCVKLIEESKDEGIYVKCVNAKGSSLLIYRPSEGFVDFILTDIELDENAVISADEKSIRRLRDYLNEVLGEV